MKQKVIFICIHNSARSQMAEAFLNEICGDQFEAHIAGLEPGKLNPIVVEAIQEIGIDISGNKTKAVEDMLKSGKIFPMSSSQPLDSSTNNHVGTIVGATYAGAATPTPHSRLTVPILTFTLPTPQPFWSNPVTLVNAYGRIALGNRVHVVDHAGGNLVYRNSQDNGATWSSPSIVAPASANYPMQYGAYIPLARPSIS